MYLINILALLTQPILALSASESAEIEDLALELVVLIVVSKVVFIVLFIFLFSVFNFLPNTAKVSLLLRVTSQTSQWQQVQQQFAVGR